MERDHKKKKNFIYTTTRNIVKSHVSRFEPKFSTSYIYTYIILYCMAHA